MRYHSACASQLDYHSLHVFGLALDRHYQKNSTFFNHDLLSLLSDSLGFSELTVSTYENRKFCGLIAHSSNVPRASLPMIEEWYCTKFQPIDPFGCAISEYTKNHQTDGVNLLLSSDLISSEHGRNVYREHLKSLNLCGSVAVPFNGNRLTIHSTKPEGGFSDIELDRIYSMCEILQQKYHIYLERAELQRKLELQQLVLRGSNVGYLVFGEDGQLLEINDHAIHFLSEMEPNSNHLIASRHLFSHLLDSLQKSDEPCSQIQQIDKDYEINCTTSFSPISSGSASKCYAVSICHRQSASREACVQNFKTQYALSNRELEVIELLHQGKRYEDIAKQLFISISTIRTHVKNIFSKCNVSNQRALLFLYTQFI